MRNENPTFRRFAPDEEDESFLETELISKTSRLKQITIQLGDEIKNSNKFIDDLDNKFSKSQNILTATIGRVGKLARNGNCKIYFYLILFSLFVFFVLYLVIKLF